MKNPKRNEIWISKRNKYKVLIYNYDHINVFFKSLKTKKFNSICNPLVYFLKDYEFDKDATEIYKNEEMIRNIIE